MLYSLLHLSESCEFSWNSISWICFKFYCLSKFLIPLNSKALFPAGFFCLFVLFAFFKFFSFIFISWRLITLQYCSGFCHTLTWISHGVTKSNFAYFVPSQDLNFFVSTLYRVVGWDEYKLFIALIIWWAECYLFRGKCPEYSLEADFRIFVKDF